MIIIVKNSDLTLQIGSVTFPTEQCPISQLHPCIDYLTKMGIKTVP